MPRDSTGTYTPPGGTTAIPGATITADEFNNFVTDIGAEMSATATKAGLVDTSGVLITAGTSSAYTLATITPTPALADGLRVGFRPHVTNTAPAITLTGTLTAGSAVITDITVPAGVLPGPIVTSTTTGIPSGATITAKTSTTLVLSAPHAGTTTAMGGAQIAIASTTASLAIGTNDPKPIVGIDGFAVPAGELVAGWAAQARYDATAGRFVLGTTPSRVRTSLTDPRPGTLTDKFIVSDGSAVPVQTDPNGNQRLTIPASSLLVGDVIQSARQITSGYLRCNGATYLQSAYTALFSVISQGYAQFSANVVSPGGTGLVTQRLYSSLFGRWAVFTVTPGASGTINYKTSADKTTYSAEGTISSGQSNPLVTNFAEGNGRIVGFARARTGPTTAVPITSTNGTAFAAGTALASFPAKNVAFGAGLFVASRLGSGTAVVTSPDGVTWTSRTVAVTNFTSATVAFGNGVFVLVSDEGVVYRSTDGINWAQVTTPGIAAGTSRTMLFGGGQFVLGGASIYASPDGVTWTVKPLGGKPRCYMAGLWFIDSYYTADFFNNQIATTTNDETLDGNAGQSGTVADFFHATDGLSVAATGTSVTTVSYLTPTNNFASDFRVPNITSGTVPSYIRTAA